MTCEGSHESQSRLKRHGRTEYPKMEGYKKAESLIQHCIQHWPGYARSIYPLFSPIPFCPLSADRIPGNQKEGLVYHGIDTCPAAQLQCSHQECHTHRHSPQAGLGINPVLEILQPCKHGHFRHNASSPQNPPSVLTF